MMNYRIQFLLAVLPAVSGWQIAVAGSADDWTPRRFDNELAPLIVARCFDCHSGSEPKGELDLSSEANLLRGGESGRAVLPGNANASLLWQKVEAGEMPPETPLTRSEMNLIRDWITAGAVWGASPIDPFRFTSSQRAGYDWWSLQPLRRPDVPTAAGGRTAIDRFIRTRLAQAGIPPSARAAPRTLIRRLSFDLLGLPPSPADIHRFEAAMRKDPGGAIDSLLDQLLASPHFGERWGRHWLDIVRFGESQGFERDKLRDDSWYYRDWVVDAMNEDMPYDQFARWQLAGDVLHADVPRAVIATGFLVAGPYDEVGQKQQSAAMRAVVRQDELEDYVGTIAQSFLGLTVNCARCHDHKFDPIRQSEYYRLAAAVAGVRHGHRMVVTRQNQQRIRELDDRIKTSESRITAIEHRVRRRLTKARKEQLSNLPPRVQPVARWDFKNDFQDQIGTVHATANSKASIANGRLVLNGDAGYAVTSRPKYGLKEKTLEAVVRLDNLVQRGGAAISIHETDGNAFDAIVFGERHPGKWIAGSDSFRRTKDLDVPIESDADEQSVHLAITYDTDGTISIYRNGEPYGAPYRVAKLHSFAPNKFKVMFGLRKGGPSPDRQLRGQLEVAQLYDRPLTAAEVRRSYEHELANVTHDSILSALSEQERLQRQNLSRRIESLSLQRSRLQPYSVYAADPTEPETTYVLLRGNPASRGDIVQPGGVASVRGVTSDFGLPVDSADSERRRKLASWITDARNPLFARVIVNRLWHYHFSVGLVETPNDFGFNGGRPSHPELIEWLASELVDSGWSLKHIHRLICSSSTYLQASRYRPECAVVDAENRLLWRKTPMRLEAEAIRDTVLSVSGQLNKKYGGPPYRDFETFNFNSQFYNMIDPDGHEYYRRTVYRTWIRSGRNYLLDAFDCPDPSTTAPQRAVTTTPIQSLTLLNNSFILRMADRFAERVQKDETTGSGNQIERVYALAYGRRPRKEKADQVKQFISTYGLPDFCRVVFNSNEFVYVD